MSRVFVPSELLHAQDSIHHRFRDGRTLDSSLRDLLRYANPGDRLPPMDVMIYGGKHFVVDGNRRLYLLKQLEAAGLVDTVSVNMLSFNSCYFNRKHTTDCGGVSIRIRNDFSMESKIRNIIQQHIKDKSKTEQHGRYSGSSTPGRQERSIMDFGFGALSPSPFIQPKAATIEERHLYSLGNVKYRWVIRDIAMRPKETVFKLCRQYNTDVLTTREIAEALKAVVTQKEMFVTTKLNMDFCRNTNSALRCDLYLDQLEGTYENMFEMVKSFHSDLQK